MRERDTRLVALLVAAILPVVAVASALVLYAARQERRAVEADTRARVARVVDLVDREVEAHLRVLEALATSASLDRPDLRLFHEEARRALPSQPGWLTVILLDPDGRQLLSARQPFDRPPVRVIEPASFGELLRTRRPAVGGISEPSPLTGVRAVPLRVPVERGGALRHVLTAPVAPDALSRLLRDAGLVPADWTGAVLDREGRIIARSRDPEAYVGRAATAPTLAAARSGAESGLYDSRTIDGVEVVAAFATSPVTGWTVHLGVPRAAFDAPRRRAILTTSLGGLACVLLAAALAWLVQRDVAARRRQDEALRRAQAMEAVGRMTGGVAHDFNNLLTVVRGSAELLRRRPDDPRREFFLDGIVQATERGAKLTRQLLSFAGRRASRPEVVDLAAHVAGLGELVRSTLRGEVELRVEVADGLWPVEVDPVELELALLNLVANARDAIPPGRGGGGGLVRLSAANAPLPPAAPRGGRPAADAPPDLAGDHVRLAVADDGGGMPPGVAERAFEPFFTTKERGKGTGLGLSQVYGFARQSGGAATITSRPGAGTTVALYLPRSRKPLPAGPAPAAADARSDAPRAEGRRARVLLVEDDPAVAAATTALLEQLGHAAVAVDRADAALDLLARDPEGFALVLSDIVMPGGTDGIGLAREVRRRFPGTPVLLATGYSSRAEMVDAQGRRRELPAGLRVLAKPYDAATLQGAIEVSLCEAADANAAEPPPA